MSIKSNPESKFIEGSDGLKRQVILGAEIHPLDSSDSNVDRGKSLHTLMRETSASHCLVSGNTVVISRRQAVSFLIQVIELGNRYELNDSIIISEVGSKFYIVEADQFGIPVAATERLVDQDGLFEAIRGKNAITLGGLELEQASPVDFALATGGDAVAPYLFRPEKEMFSLAELPHPSRYRAIYKMIAGIVIVAVAVISYWVFVTEKTKAEAEAKSQSVPPPLIAGDVCVAQLRAYADWLDDNYQYFSDYGVTEISFTAGRIAMKGRPHKTLHKLFKVDMAKQNVGVGLLGQSSSEDDQPPATSKIFDTRFSDTSTWVIDNYGGVVWTNPPKFGLRDQSGYLNALFHAIPRVGMTFQIGPNRNTVTPSTVSLNATVTVGETASIIAGPYHSSYTLHRISDALLGVPARCDKVVLTREIGTDERNLLITSSVRGKI